MPSGTTGDHAEGMHEDKMADQDDTKQGESSDVGGCAGAHKAWLEGKSGTFHMAAKPVPKIEAPPPLAAKPLPPTNELYVICGRKEIGDRRGKSFPLMRRWDDGKLRPWDVFIVRKGKEYFAYENSCPHTGQRLDWEKNNFYEPNYMKVLMCGKHGAEFDVETGVCTKGPCQGQRLTSILCLVDEDDVCLTGINIDLDAEVEPVKVTEGDEVLENNGFKLQQTKREFL